VYTVDFFECRTLSVQRTREDFDPHAPGASVALNLSDLFAAVLTHCRYLALWPPLNLLRFASDIGRRVVGLAAPAVDRQYDFLARVRMAALLAGPLLHVTPP